MANVQSIVPAVWTSTAADSGTDGDVYLGIGGREFHLDSPSDDFERGNAANTTVGVNSQVNNPSMNDPRTPYVLRTQDLDLFPVYLRLEGSDHWKVSFALVLVFSGPNASSMAVTDWFSADVGYDGGQGGLWLGPHAGRWLYLRRSTRALVTKQLRAAKLLDAAKPFLSPPLRPSRRK
jgi:hypothetical protein